MNIVSLLGFCTTGRSVAAWQSLHAAHTLQVELHAVQHAALPVLECWLRTGCGTSVHAEPMRHSLAGIIAWATSAAA